MFFVLFTKLKRILAKKTEPSPVCRSDGTPRRVRKAIEEWITQKRWTEEATMQDVADSLGLLKEDLSLYFRRKFRKGFLKWRTETRIEEAKRLLLSEKKTPTFLIGEEVGIFDKSNFKRLFRSLTGITPAQWRSKHKGHIVLH